jgi:hypothetical protein
MQYQFVEFELLAYDGQTNNLSNDCSSGCKVMQQLPLSLKLAELQHSTRCRACYDMCCFLWPLAQITLSRFMYSHIEPICMDIKYYATL